MYLDGILKINENKALVLLIIKIDEKNLILCDDIYIFSSGPNFDKIPTTVHNVFHTSSSIEGLDNSEPEDNPNIIPYLNVDELSKKFSQFDSEQNVKPKVKVSFCITNNRWAILYIKDSE